MAKQKNMFGSFGAAVEQREQEQQQIEAVVTGKSQTQSPAKAVGRPRKRQDATQITLIISKADKEKVKAYAFNHAVTVSDLLHRWIEENCTD